MKDMQMFLYGEIGGGGTLRSNVILDSLNFARFLIATDEDDCAPPYPALIRVKIISES